MTRQMALATLPALILTLAACASSGEATIQKAAATPTTPTATPAVQAIATDHNVVTNWAAIVQPAIHSATAPRSPASAEVLATIVHLAVYDAVVAIKGGYSPYAAAIEAPGGANLDAAVATAAYRAARGRVAPTQLRYLDEQYGAYLAAIPDGAAKTDGVVVGDAAAAGILAKRAGDGYDNTVAYLCSAAVLPVGEFEPGGGCGTEPIDARIAQVTPFTFSDPAQFRPDGPDVFTSDRWARDFEEVKAYGGMTSSVRTAEQSDLVHFWSEHAYVHWNRNLIALATARDLDSADTARLFAMAHTAAADAVVAGFEAKYSYRSWRPRTAIPRAAEDGNPQTSPDPTWTPLLSVDHPEYPSGHAFFSTALTDAVAAFFGTREVAWTLATNKAAVPQLVAPERTYPNLDALMKDVTDARVWAGLHYRNSMHEGATLGRQVANHVLAGYFRPVT
ncbi:MAG: vanadium-dependent haloperoxidase [Sporichthyaceae bacterium]